MSKREENKCKLMFEKKKKNKAHMATKPTSSHFPFLPHHTRSLLKGALMKFTWEPYFSYGLYILNTYPHYTRSFGALNEEAWSSNFTCSRLGAFHYFLEFSLYKLFSLFLFFLSHDWLNLLLGLGAMFSA